MYLVVHKIFVDMIIFYIITKNTKIIYTCTQPNLIEILSAITKLSVLFHIKPIMSKYFIYEVYTLFTKFHLQINHYIS